MTYSQVAQLAEQRTVNPSVAGSIPALGAMTTYIKYATRTNDGVCQEHPSLEQALEFFTAEDGYRLDFLYPDGRVLYIHRAEYGEDIDSPFIDHPTFMHYHIANGKVLYYDPNSKHILNEDDNIIRINFGNH